VFSSKFRAESREPWHRLTQFGEKVKSEYDAYFKAWYSPECPKSEVEVLVGDGDPGYSNKSNGLIRIPIAEGNLDDPDILNDRPIQDRWCPIWKTALIHEMATNGSISAFQKFILRQKNFTYAGKRSATAQVQDMMNNSAKRFLIQHQSSRDHQRNSLETSCRAMPSCFRSGANLRLKI
jgi:hypothetical protein